MTSDRETALTVYLDPNYDPTFSYSHLEGWLLLYDKIYISSPSPYQVKRAHRELDVPLVSERSLQDLVRQGWMVPIGRSRFFTEDWRSSRAEELGKIDPVRAAHFSWSGEFDVVMATHAQRLPDSELDEAIETGTALEKRYPDAFAEVLRRVNVLRAEGLLPAKFYSPSEIVKDSIEIAKGVLYEVAGDLWVRRHLGTTGMIVPSEHEAIYALLDSADDGWSPLEPQIGAAIRRAPNDLSEQDLLLARELAERILHNYTVSDVLAEYRDSALQHQFRAFVLKAMEDLRKQGGDTSDASGLWARFQQQIDTIQKTQDIGGYLAGFGSAAIGLHPDMQKLLQQGLTRRALLMLVLFKAGEVAGRPLLGPPLDRARSAIFDSSDRWISLIARRATKR